MPVCSSYNSKGFTLIELLVSTVILSTIFAFGYAGFRDYSRRQSVEAVARQIRGDLKYAQGLASAGSKPNTAVPNYARCSPPNVLNGYNFVVVAGGASYQVEAVCSGGAPVTVRTVALTDTTLSPAGTLTFKSLGQGTSLAAGSSTTYTVRKSSTTITATVIVTASGEVK